MEMISVTDLGAESVTIDDETNQVSEPIQREISLEEMAFGAAARGVNTNSNSGFAPKPTCRICSAPNAVGERFLYELWEVNYSVGLKNPCLYR